MWVTFKHRTTGRKVLVQTDTLTEVVDFINLLGLPVTWVCSDRLQLRYTAFDAKHVWPGDFQPGRLE